MVVSLKANRRRLLILLGLIALLAVVYFALVRPGAKDSAPAAGTNEERLRYINSFGWTVETEPLEVAEVTIPAQFNEVYTAYNALQQRQGFDLLDYAGQTCAQYKYTVTNYDSDDTVYLCLLVRDDKVIGADISSAQLGGFMHGLNERPGASPTPQATPLPAPEASADAPQATPAG